MLANAAAAAASCCCVHASPLSVHKAASWWDVMAGEPAVGAGQSNGWADSLSTHSARAAAP